LWRPSPRLVAREYPQQAMIRAFGRNFSSPESIIVVEARTPGRRRSTRPGDGCQIPLPTPTGPRPGLSYSSQLLAGPVGCLKLGGRCSVSHAHDPEPPGLPGPSRGPSRSPSCPTVSGLGVRIFPSTVMTRSTRGPPLRVQWRRWACLPLAVSIDGMLQ
jgi:hypothetical protein